MRTDDHVSKKMFAVILTSRSSAAAHSYLQYVLASRCKPHGAGLETRIVSEMCEQREADEDEPELYKYG